MKLLIVFLATLFLVGCDTSSPSKDKGKDRYWFETKEYEKTELGVSVRLYANKADLQLAAKAKGITNWEYIQAFGVLKPYINSCTIHIVDPMNNYEPEYYGHELAHCIWGKFHNNQNKSSNAVRPEYILQELNFNGL